MNEHRRAAQIAQCCRGCPCKSVADCTSGANTEKVAEYIKETAHCRYCGQHEGLVAVVKVATGETRVVCQDCACFMDSGRYALA